MATQVSSRPRLLARAGLALLGLLLAGTLAGGVWLRVQLARSLPQLDGEATVPGLEHPVRVERDALGVPAITAASLADAMRALGYLHAQDRFFQMDLLRRQPTGELAALVGPAALEADRAARRHRFREVARRALALMAPTDRARLDAYAAGVNAGLSGLGAPPFEYLLLRVAPEPWRPEDSLAAGLAMYQDLQNPAQSFEPIFAVMQDVLPAPLFEFLAARASDWETPVEGEAMRVAAPPGSEVADLRRLLAGPDRPAAPGRARADQPAGDEEIAAGSNNWALAGSFTEAGAALVANDMHLRLGVPNIWYRTAIAMPDPVSPGETLRFAGVTLPGLPMLIVGSNGHIAWGFTNSHADWHDLVVVEVDPADPSRYLTPDGPRPFETVVETIAVKGGPAETVEVRWTIWGPVWDTDHRGRPRALRWVAHSAEAIAAPMDRFAFARDVEAALALAARSSPPGQNLVVGDRAGRIGWTVLGMLPRRVGFSGEIPVSWSDGRRGWDGWLPAVDYPRIVDPPDGRLWTANARVVGGEKLRVLGEGNYADGIRARIIRDALRRLSRASPADMLRVQLDDEARFLERWRGLILDVLAPDALVGHPGRAEYRRVLETTWTGRASIDSAAYRLVRHTRGLVAQAALAPFDRLWRDVAPEVETGRLRRIEGPLWRLVTERPPHLLDPAYASWDALLLDAVDGTVAELAADGRALADRTWGEVNRADIAHPLAGAVPLFGRWLRMPPDPLPGDVHTPRASSPRAGASQRLAVSPGREDEGILHMPVGQSGHPRSPFYRSHHEAWVRGEPLPLLPGPAVHVLTLRGDTP